MAGIDEYNISAGSNSSINSIDIAELCIPSNINNSIRQLMADLRRFANDIGAKAVSSGTDTVTLTTETVLTAYADGTVLGFIAGGTNTGATTLNVDGVGAKAVRKNADAALAAGDITAGQAVFVVYDASANSAAGAWLIVGRIGINSGSIVVSDLAGSAVVIESEGIASNDNDTTFPTSAAVKDYVCVHQRTNVRVNCDKIA